MDVDEIMFEKQNAITNVWFVVHSSNPEEKLCGCDSEEKADKIVAALNAVKISDIAAGIELAEGQEGFAGLCSRWPDCIKQSKDTFMQLLWKKDVSGGTGAMLQTMTVKIKGGKQ